MQSEQALSHNFSQELANRTVADAYSSQLLTVYEGWSIKKLSQFFLKHGISGAPVIAADEELVGVVSQSDIIRFESNTPSESEISKLVEHMCGPFAGNINEAEIRRIQDKANDYCTVNSIMTPYVISVDISTSLLQAYSMMADKHIHRVFVTKNGLLVGVISAMNILSFIARQ